MASLIVGLDNLDANEENYFVLMELKFPKIPPDQSRDKGDTAFAHYIGV